MRGIALRVKVSADEQHDLLATNYHVSHARNARQFVRLAVATAGGTLSRLIGIAGLMFSEGPSETIRMLRNVSAGRRQIKSVALETYWSRGALRWGPKLAVRFLLRPASPIPLAGPDLSKDPEGLSKEAAARLAAGAIQFELCVQRFVDAEVTPIEDTSVAWTPEAAPVEKVATLTIPQADVNTPEARDAFRIINALAFNPWNTTDEFRPLGNLNRARKDVYDASAAHRLQMRWRDEPPLRNRVFAGLFGAFFKLINRRFEWYRLPLLWGLLNLDANRAVLRRQNLIDTEPVEAPPAVRPTPPPEPPEEMRTTRSFTGEWNDLSVPKMGAVGATFGRNLKPDFKQSLEEPNPILVARALLDRKTFLPARSLNLLAAAWIQFQVHDWVNHAREKLGVNDVKVPLPDPSASWINAVGGAPEQEMRIAGNKSLDGAEHAPVRKRCVALVGRIGSLWQMTTRSPRRCATARKSGSITAICRSTNQAWRSPASARASGWLERPAHAVRPRAQSALRRVARPLSPLERRPDLPYRAADRDRADRKDPHRRMDAGDPGDQGDRHRPRAATGKDRPRTTGSPSLVSG